MSETHSIDALQLSDALERDARWLAEEHALCIDSMRSARDELRRQHAEIEQMKVERDAAIEARRSAQVRQEQLTAEIVSLEPMRQREADIARLAKERAALRGVPTELIACLIDARDDVAAELQRCREAAGYPSTDRRLAAQEALLERVDAAISAATGENNPC